MFPVIRRPARRSQRLVLAAGGWLVASLCGLADGSAQQALIQQAEQVGAAAMRKAVVGQPGGPTGGLVGKAEQAGENALRKVSGQPPGQPGTPTGGVVGRFEQVGENGVRKVIGAPPSGPPAQPQPQPQPTPPQGGLLGTSRPLAQQGSLVGAAPPAPPPTGVLATSHPATQPTSSQPSGLLGKTQQAGGAMVNKVTGSSNGGAAVDRMVSGAKTLAQKAATKRSTAPSQASAPRPQATPTPARSLPHPSGGRAAGAPPS